MNNISLPKHFFENNPLNEISAALLTHFRMIALTMSELDEQISKIVVPGMEKVRYKQSFNSKSARVSG